MRRRTPPMPRWAAVDWWRTVVTVVGENEGLEVGGQKG